jgi:ethanolamine utilization protein EutM
MQNAIGMIETKGLVAMIEAADQMLKAADVHLRRKEKIGGGYMTVIVEGEVAAVKAAVEVGSSRCKKGWRTVCCACDCQTRRRA